MERGRTVPEANRLLGPTELGELALIMAQGGPAHEALIHEAEISGITIDNGRYITLEESSTHETQVTLVRGRLNRFIASYRLPDGLATLAYDGTQMLKLAESSPIMIDDILDADERFILRSIHDVSREEADTADGFLATEILRGVGAQYLDILKTGLRNNISLPKRDFLLGLSSLDELVEDMEAQRLALSHQEFQVLCVAIDIPQTCMYHWFDTRDITNSASL